MHKQAKDDCRTRLPPRQGNREVNEYDLSFQHRSTTRCPELLDKETQPNLRNTRRSRAAQQPQTHAGENVIHLALQPSTQSGPCHPSGWILTSSKRIDRSRSQSKTSVFFFFHNRGPTTLARFEFFEGDGPNARKRKANTEQGGICESPRSREFSYMSFLSRFLQTR